MTNASWHRVLFVVLTFGFLSALTAHAQFRYEDRPSPRPEPRSDRYDRHDRYDQYDPYNPYDPYPVQDEVIEARVQQNLYRGSRLHLSQFLYARNPNVEVLSLTIHARSYGYYGGSLQILSRGRQMETHSVSQYGSPIYSYSHQLGSLDELELSSLDDVMVESITARVRRIQGPQIPQGPHYPRVYPVAAHSLVTLEIHQDIHGRDLPLEQLVRQQLGQTLQGAEIERVVVEGDPVGRGQAMVGVRLNSRLASQMKALSYSSRMLPLPVSSSEAVRSLELVVQGSARIQRISIRIGRVR